MTRLLKGQTITAEEARKVVAAGGAVARTFVAPVEELEYGTIPDFAAMGGEWVVRRAAPEKPSVLTVEERAALSIADDYAGSGAYVEVLAKALRRLEALLNQQGDSK